MMDRLKRRLLALLRAAFSVAVALAVLAGFLVFYDNSPLPDAWNPRVPLEVRDPVTPVTSWKLKQALSGGEQCLAALDNAAEFTPMADFEHSAQCHIRSQVALQGVAQAQVSEVNTRCQIALRMAMWMEHGIAPAAERHFGQGVARVHHLSSYNCRQIRTSSGTVARMSTHATADAIDITGFTLENGRKITLLQDWDGNDPAASAFLRDVRDSACDWFRVTLGPDYNALHADHFHLQHTGWGSCR